MGYSLAFPLVPATKIGEIYNPTPIGNSVYLTKEN